LLYIEIVLIRKLLEIVQSLTIRTVLCAHDAVKL